MRRLIALLEDPSIRQLDVDGSDRLVVHRKMLARKAMLRDVFREFHRTFRRLDERFFTGTGSRIELGAGVAPVRDLYKDVLATDIVPAPQLDRVLDAQALDLPDGSVRAIYGQNFFHHLPCPDRFFKELERVVAPGGGAILLEPYHGPFATFLYKRLFKTEGFDKHYPTWETPVIGPMNGANQALSYIVFTRDRAEFERRYPHLRIVHREYCSNYWLYLMSGGLNFRQLMPDWSISVIKALQFVLSPLDRWLALHHVVVIQRIER